MPLSVALPSWLSTNCDFKAWTKGPSLLRLIPIHGTRSLSLELGSEK